MSELNYKLIANHIVDWLNSYIEHISIKGFTLGVSGGVDSAVVATLCALTKKEVLLLSLPIRQASSEHARAQKQIDYLVKNFPNVKTMEVDLTASFNSFEDSLPTDTKENLLAMANSRSRLRMMTLYAIAQANQLLVTGTGNKIEDYGIGFFTKYGDGGVDINPIGDLLKSEVYQLAKELNVIEEILNARPTDGLWSDGRTDEDQIGATYDELEFAMTFEGDVEELNERQLHVLELYRKLHAINQHKVQPIPICEVSHLRK